MNSFIGLVILSRIITSSLIALAVFLPSVLTGHKYMDAILTSLPFFLAAIGGFALNDYFDASKDRINKPYRAIPSGRLRPGAVVRYGVTMLVAASVTSLVVSHTFSEVALYGACISGVAAYNLFVKYFSLSKTFLTSIISGIPLLFSVRTYGYPDAFIALPIATSLFVLGREWLMDIRDVDGDSADGIATIPMKIGPTATARVAFGFQILAVCLLIPIAVINRSFYSFFLVSIIFCCVLILAKLWWFRSDVLQRRVIQLFWLPMLFGVMLFFGG